MARLALCLLIVWCALGMALAGGTPEAATSLVAARAALLMDCRTGLVLWEQNADTPLPMASTTKIMTAMVILDHRKDASGRDRMGDTVTVSRYAASTGGSSQFAQGDRVVLRDLLVAALVRSSNEATVAAAEYLAGSEQQFVTWMNEKAAFLGLKRTHFVNPHGLTRGDEVARHYTTAHELAIIARYALNHYPEINQIIVMAYPRSITVMAEPRGPVVLENRNRIVNQPVPGLPGSIVDGVKTGYINASGKCYVTSATYRNWRLIAVLLDSPDIFAEGRTLLQYGFTRYAWRTYASPSRAGLLVPVARGARRTVPVGAKELLGAPVPQSLFRESASDEVTFSGTRLTAPITAGAQVGTLELRRNGTVIASAPAITLQEIPVAGWIRVARALGFSLLTLILLLMAIKVYGTVTKITRRRRRRLAAAQRGYDYGRARDR